MSVQKPPRPLFTKLAIAGALAASVSLIAVPFAGATGPTAPGAPRTDASYTSRTVAQGLASPFDVGVAANGQMYVGNNSGAGQLLRLTPFGTDPTVLETLASFDNLYQASVDSSNLWYVGDSSGLFKANLDGTSPASFDPSAVSYALDGAGNIFVNDYHSVVAETTAGTGATTILSGLGAVYNIATNSQGQVFVPDWGNDEILRVNADGTGKTTIASGALYQQVAGIAADAEGDVFFSLQGPGTVYEMKSDGSDLRQIAHGLNGPFGITATPSGDLFIGVRDSGTVVELTPNNRVAGFGSATIDWQAPVSDGGSPILSYVVVATGADGSIVSSSFPAGTRTAGTVYGLRNGLAYTFTVQAVNAVGAGAAVPFAGSVRPGVPSQMGAPHATIGARRVTLHWTAPYNGNTPLNGYVVTVTQIVPHPAPFNVTVSPTATSVVVGGLTDGAQYAFDVAASADNGTGAPSTSVVAPPAAPPSPPTGVTAAAGNLFVEVRWRAPASDGGAPVIRYIVTSTPGSRTCITRTLTCLVTRLLAGHAYSFRVVAVNASGQSTPSRPTRQVTPTKPPSQ